MKNILLILLTCISFSINAQVKIGDNPQSIDQNSILELESSDKVLVVSRLNNNQMNSITPLNGAIVYNTDEQCLFQYNDSSWTSLCVDVLDKETVTSLIDNNDGSFTYTNEEGTLTIIQKASLIDNGDGTFTFDNGNGSTITFDGANSETLTTIVDNGDGTLTYTDEDGVETDLDIANIVDNFETLTFFDYDAVTTELTYTDEDGTANVYNLGNLVANLETLTTIVDNGDGTLTYTDEDGVETDLDIANIVDNFETLTFFDYDAVTTELTYTDEDGTANVYNLGNLVANLETLTTVVDNGDGTLTYTDEDGVETDLDIANIVDNFETLTFLDYDAVTTELTYTDEDGTANVYNLGNLVANLETLTTIVDNGDGTLTYTDEDGVETDLDIANIVDNFETLTFFDYDAVTTELTYTDEDGTANVYNLGNLVANLETLTTIVDNGDGTLTYTDEDGVETDLDIANIVDNFETLTFFDYDAVTTELTYTDEDGTANVYNLGNLVANLETLTTIVDNGDGTLTYTDEDGVETDLDIANIVDNFETLTFFDYDAVTTELTYTDEDGTANVYNLGNLVANLETLTTIVDNGDGTLTYTDEDGVETDLDIANIVDNFETLTFFDYDAVTTELTYTDEDGTANVYNLGNLVANLETLTTIVDNGDGTLTYTDEDGVETDLDIANIVDNFETLTFFDYDAVTTELTYTDEDGTANVYNLGNLVANLETLTTIVDNGDGTLTYTDEDGVETDLNKADITFDATTGIYTFTNNDGTDVNFTSGGLVSATDDNTSATVNQIATITNADATTVPVEETITALVENTDGTYTYTPESGPAVTVNKADITFDATTGIYTFTNNDGTDVSFTSGGLVSATDDNTSATVNQIATITNADATTVPVEETITALVENTDGTYTYTPESGPAVTVNKADITFDATTGIYTFTNNDGTDVNFTSGGLVSATDDNTSATVNQIATITNADATTVPVEETITALVENTDGTYTYTPESGPAVTVNKADITFDATTGIYTFTNNDGTDVNFTSGGLVSATDDNTSATVNQIATITNADATTVPVEETITALVENTDGTYTYTPESGPAVTVNKADITFDATTGIYTFTNNDGTDVNFTSGGLVSATDDNTSATVNQIATITNADATTVPVEETITALVENTDGTYTYTPESGPAVTVNKADITFDATTGIYTFTNNDGTDVNFTSGGLVSATDDNTSATVNQIATITNADATTVPVEETITALVENTDGTYTYTPESGPAVTVNKADITFDATTGIYTFTNNDGTDVSFTSGGLVSATDDNTSATVNQIATITNADATTVPVEETITALVENTDGTYTYTPESGPAVTVNKADITFDATTGIYTFTNNDGTDVSFTSGGLVSATDDNTSATVNQIATITNADATTVPVEETITALVENTDGTYTYTPESGPAVTVNKADITFDATTGVYTFTNNDGTDVNFTSGGLVSATDDNTSATVNQIATITNADATTVPVEETITALVENTDGTYTYTPESGPAVTVNKADITFDATTGVYTFTNNDGTDVSFTSGGLVSATDDNTSATVNQIATITNADATTVPVEETITALVENTDGTYTYTPESGPAVTVNKADITFDATTGIYTFTNNDGTDVSFTSGGLVSATDDNTSATVNQIATITNADATTVPVEETITALVENTDGTYTYTPESGPAVTVNKADITFDATTGIYTFTNNDGTDVSFTSGGLVSATDDNTSATVNQIATITNADATTVPVEETITALVENTDGTYTYTPESGPAVTVNKADITFDATTGIYTFTNNDGTDVSFTSGGLVSATDDNTSATVNQIATITNADATTVPVEETITALVENTDGTYTYTPESGPAVTVNKADITFDATTGIYTFTNNDGTDVSFTSGGLVSATDDNTSATVNQIATITNADATTVPVEETITALVENTDGTYTYTPESGPAVTVNKADITFDATTGIYTFTNNDGTDVSFTSGGLVSATDDNTSATVNQIATITNADATTVPVEETITALVENTDGTYTYTPESGPAVTVNKADITFDATTGIYTFTNNDGTDVSFTSGGLVSATDDNTSATVNQIATITNADATTVPVEETITALVENTDGTYTYTPESGPAVTVNKADITFDATTGIYTFTNNDGTDVNFTSGGLVSATDDNTSATVNQIATITNADATTVPVEETITALVENTDGTYTYTPESGPAVTVNKADITFDATTGIYTFTNNDGTDVNFTSGGLVSATDDNTSATVNQIATITNADATTVPVEETITALVENTDGTYTYTPESGPAVTVNKADITFDATTGIYTFTNNDGTDVSFTSGGLVSATDDNTSATVNQIATITNADATTVPVEETITALVENTDGTYTYTPESGPAVTVNKADITFDATTGIYTFTNNDGTDVSFTSGGLVSATDDNTSATVNQIATITNADATTVPVEETITALVENTDGTYTYTPESGPAVTVNKADITFDATTGVYTFTNNDGTDVNFTSGGLVSATDDNTSATVNQIATITNADATTVPVEETITALVENTDGTYTYTPESGPAVTVNKADITFDATTGVYTFTNNDGTDVSFTSGGLVSATDDNTSATVNQIATITNADATTVPVEETITALVENTDGTYTYTPESGPAVTVNKADITFDATTGIYTFTNNDGTDVSFTSGGLVSATDDNTSATVNQIATITNADATTVPVEETITALVENTDGTYTYTPESGPAVTVNKADITFDATTGIYTFTNNDGTDVSFTSGGLVSATDDNTSATVNQIATITNADATTVPVEETITALVENTDGTYTYTPESGPAVTVNKADITFDATTGIYTFTNNDGTDVSFTSGGLVSATDDNTSATVNQIATITNADATTVPVEETITALVENTDGTYTYTPESGPAVTVNKADITFDATTGIYTFTNNDGTDVSFTSGGLVSATDDNTSATVNQIATITNADATTVPVEETITALVENTDGTYTYTPESGPAVTVNKADITFDATTGVYTFTNNDGTDVNFTSGGLVSATDDNTSATVNQIATITNADATTVPVEETITALVENTDGTYTYTPESGPAVTVNKADITFDATTGIYTFTNNDGTDVSFTSGGLVSATDDNTSATVNQIATITNADATTVPVEETITALVENTDGTYTYTPESGPAVTVNKADITFDATTGVYTFTNNDGTDVSFTSGGLVSATDDNTSATVNQIATITNADATTVPVEETITALVENTDGTYTYTPESGPAVTVNKADITFDATTGIYTFTNNDGTDVNFTSGGLVSATDDNTSATVNQIATITNADATTVPVEETITELGIAAGELTFDNEGGTNANVNLISTDTNNSISAGTDGALFVDVAGTETVTDVTDLNAAAATNLIGTYNNEEGDPFAIEETVTELTFEATTNELEFVDETGTLNAVNLSSLAHTGTEGSIFFAGVDTEPTEDNDQLFWDATNNRLGVGTNTPDNKLQVTGAIRSAGFLNSDGNASEPSYRFTDDTNTGMYSPAADEIALTVGGFEALKVDEPTTGNTVVIINQTLDLDGPVLDENDSPGTAGQILTATANGTEWTDAITETVTTFTQDDTTTTTDPTATGEITYTDETGTPFTAQVVSNEADNDIEVGSNGGAYFVSPIRAAGKVNANGTTTIAPLNSTVVRNALGTYTITFDAAARITNANYIIQLTVRDSEGLGNDDYDISYRAQTATSFIVQVGDNDNGGSARVNRDFEFMFTVITY